MTEHSYFGQVKKDWCGFSAEHKFEIPYFDVYGNVTSVKVYLGEQYDEDYKEIETPPTNHRLMEFEQTLKDFLNNIDSVIVDIQQSAFERYQRIYARYYEKPFEVLFQNAMVRKAENNELHSPLNIDTKEKHFEYMKIILETIRVSENQTITIPITYALDEEHGLELKIVNNKVAAVDGIGET